MCLEFKVYFPPIIGFSKHNENDDCIPMFDSLLNSLVGRQGDTKAPKASVDQTFADYASIVKEVFDDLEVSSIPEHLDAEDALWMTNYGSAILLTSLYTDKTADELVLQVMAPLVKLPEENVLGLFNLCMRLNFNLTDCHLALSDKWGITLTAKRSAAGLNKNELEAILYRVARAADHMDTQLAEDFKAEMWGQD